MRSMKKTRSPFLIAALLLTAAFLAACGPSARQKGAPDVDLSAMSETMAYAGIADMAEEPERYLGKTVRVTGLFDMFTDGPTGNVYYACVIPDATACCMQALEFVPKGFFSFPDDFPGVGEPITVFGTFSTYLENGYEYCTLKDAEIL